MSSDPSPFLSSASRAKRLSRTFAEPVLVDLRKSSDVGDAVVEGATHYIVIARQKADSRGVHPDVALLRRGMAALPEGGLKRPAAAPQTLRQSGNGDWLGMMGPHLCNGLRHPPRPGRSGALLGTRQAGYQLCGSVPAHPLP